jgi:hypothetical protein
MQRMMVLKLLAAYIPPSPRQDGYLDILQTFFCLAGGGGEGGVEMGVYDMEGHSALVGQK